VFSEDLQIPSQVIDCKELVLEADGVLVEQKRLPGENVVSLKFGELKIKFFCELLGGNGGVADHLVHA
jgi:hypothetical protein